MLILGIDPGSLKIGYALIETSGKSFFYRSSGVLSFKGQHSFLERLGIIYHECKDIIKKFEPDEIAFESLIYVKGVTSLTKLAQARGAIVAACMTDSKKVLFEYSPNEIKSTVTGYGHSDKAAIYKTIQLIFSNDIVCKTDDESDAIAIAITHAILRDSLLNKAKARNVLSLRNDRIRIRD